MVMVKKKW